MTNEEIKNKLQRGLALTVKESWDLYKYIEALEQQSCEDCISIESVIEWLKDKDIIKTKNQEENARRELAELSSVISLEQIELKPSYNSVKTELDCVSREDAINVAIDAVDDWDGGCNTNRATMISNAIKMLPSVTPSIPDVEENFDIGYNCGYADAMCDIGGES